MYKRLLGALTLMLALTGCDLTTSPFQIQLQFFDDYEPTEGGCNVTFFAVAIGNGHAEWTSFTHLRDDAVLATYTGPEFWGDTRIEAGEEQASITLEQPESEGSYTVLMEFSTGTTPRALTFTTDCPDPDSTT
jgi:hypothetical protein